MSKVPSEYHAIKEVLTYRIIYHQAPWCGFNHGVLVLPFLMIITSKDIILKLRLDFALKLSRNRLCAQSVTRFPHKMRKEAKTNEKI